MVEIITVCLLVVLFKYIADVILKKINIYNIEFLKKHISGYNTLPDYVFSNKKLAHKLIKKGIFLDDIDNIGDTALIRASFFRETKIVDHLIMAGAKWDILNNQGIGFLTYNPENMFKYIKKYPKKYQEYIEAQKKYTIAQNARKFKII